MEPEFLDLIDKNNLIWERRLSRQKIIQWLNNFTGKQHDETVEKKIALSILKKFLYYNEPELRFLCKKCFSQIKNIPILSNPNEYLTTQASRIITNFLSNCRYSYIGNVSESGSILTSPFRQENEISVNYFFEPSSLTKENVNVSHNYFFMDDFIGTGKTAYDFWLDRLKPIYDETPDVNFYCIALVALKSGAELISNRTGFKLICPQILSKEYKIFHESKHVFPETKQRTLARDMCYYYGCSLVQEDHALGYRNSQAIVGFHHNVPDNTIPIIWSDREWIPIFRRYPKYE